MCYAPRCSIITGSAASLSELHGMTDSFTKMRSLLAEAAKQSFTWFKQQHPGDRFYAFALMTPDCVSGDPVANSEEALEAAIQRYRGKAYQIVNAGEQGAGDKPWIDLGTLRFCPDEWGGYG